MFLQCINGMESTLFVLLLVVLYAYGQRLSGDRITVLHALSLGIILGLLLLSRLNMIFIPLAMLGCSVGYLLNRATRATALRAVLAASVASTVVVTPHLVLNLVEFGSLMPISGALKSSFPTISLAPGTLGVINDRDYLFVALAVAWLVWRVLRTRTVFAAHSDYYTISTTVLAWAVELHFLDTLPFLQWVPVARILAAMPEAHAVVPREVQGAFRGCDHVVDRHREGQVRQAHLGELRAEALVGGILDEDRFPRVPPIAVPS